MAGKFEKVGGGRVEVKAVLCIANSNEKVSTKEIKLKTS
jgi:hypothetical protein